MRKGLLFLIPIGFSMLLLSCAVAKKNNQTIHEVAAVKEPIREFRAAWVATVANINWPSKPGISTREQQQEAIALLDFLQAHHFNAVVFQVRPQADALYASELEPWSYYLTGKQGQAPNPFYDPLEFWVKAAHERGMELHVWLNPYRAHHKDGKEISSSSIVSKQPSLVMKLKEGYWWMDPARKETQDHTSAVVMDIVKRYDIDGVHFDDYFYPYPSYNGDEDFPDQQSWQEYQGKGGKLSRGDWRRQAVNTLIERLYREIKATKKHVKFGLSPFGIWRPGHPASIEGFDQYDQLYADAKLWLNKGWIDYFAPQLYWPINKIPQSFPVLLGWWQQENSLQRHLWPGISVGRDSSVRNTDEILHQIMISRGMLPESMGVIHWNIFSLTKNPAMAKAILQGPYQQQALIPASPWLSKTKPASPTGTIKKNGEMMDILWSSRQETDEIFQRVIYFNYGQEKNYRIVSKEQALIQIPGFRTNAKGQQTPVSNITISVIDRYGQESDRIQLLGKE